eukprot:CAMPEP_0184096362 /NCGR_PEP_ID=MMETSP0974-20121125/10245_1 /TAXON_ID=483370 /ORGANISM="non described non described, Strain CCMP2097" /LENGTH=175 /DNA_ID=CAMNT_0026399191 /DNA_START=106 /DNA_END=633 /DNA_ORIENTATION=-
MYVASVARRESSRKAIFERTLSSSRPWRGESVSIVWLKTQCPGKTATRDASSTSGTTAAPAAAPVHVNDASTLRSMDSGCLEATRSASTRSPLSFAATATMLEKARFWLGFETLAKTRPVTDATYARPAAVSNTNTACVRWVVGRRWPKPTVDRVWTERLKPDAKVSRAGSPHDK